MCFESRRSKQSERYSKGNATATASSFHMHSIDVAHMIFYAGFPPPYLHTASVQILVVGMAWNEAMSNGQRGGGGGGGGGGVAKLQESISPTSHLPNNKWQFMLPCYNTPQSIQSPALGWNFKQRLQ